MPPSKRKPRRSRATDLQLDTSDVEMPDSSPSRPSAKKRKGNHGRATKKEKVPTPDRAPPAPPEESDDETEGLSQLALVDKVIANLAVSKEPIVVAGDHANEGADEHKVSAFAKIAGRDWTYYVREMTINIGRPPDDKQAHSIAPGTSSPAQDLKESFPVHIDLGPSKIVSRHHASIFYDADWPQDEGGWHVRVNGRNGVRVNNTLLRRGHRQQIRSGAVLEVSGTQMMFVTPTDKVEIDPYFVDKAEAAENGGDLEQNATPSENEEKPVVVADVPMYQALAPAPPNFARTSTPPPLHEHRGQQGVFDSKPGTSPMYGRGMMMESTQEIDYSRDAAKDLKPPYSYAHMIAQAIFSSDDQKLTLSNIYSFIAEKYAFYRHSNSGWQNSIRHNLSLNKAFQKVPRRTDEPGKGMKWQIAPEFRDEYWKKQQRRVGTSSNPSSPASKTDVNPNFRGANGQNLGYDTSMVYQFSAKDATNPAAAPPKLNMAFAPYPPQAQPFSGGPSGTSSQPILPASTPQRRRANTGNTMPDSGLDDSPMAPGPPQSFPSSAPRPSQGASQPFYTLPPNGPPPHQSPTNPTLSSSYLDTPFHPSQASSLLTPAPLRQNPKLAPPSTLVAPSKFMPESSPAGPGLFWKGFLGGFTPGPQSAIPPDMSPEKLDQESRPRRRHDLEDRDIMSSSPPPMDGEAPGMASPTKGKVGRSRGGTTTTAALRSPLNDTGAKLNGVVGIMATNNTSRASSSDTRPASSASGAAATTSTSFPLQAAPHPSSFPALSEPPRPSVSSRLSLGPSDAGGMFNLHPRPSSMSASPDKPLKARNEGKAEAGEADAEAEDGFDLAKGFAPIGRGRGSSLRS